jgi:hypothetical protein
VQSFGAEEQHDGLQIHPGVGPLGPAQVAVDVAEQGGGAPKQFQLAMAARWRASQSSRAMPSASL